jgi:DNA-binding NarL/FixJ family response regulator
MTEATRTEILNRYQQRVAQFELAHESRQRLGLAAAVAELAEPAPTAERAGLTKRERDVLELIADGFTDSEIGSELRLSEFTIKSHVKRLLVKLSARNRAHAVALAVRRDLLALPMSA